MRKLLTTILFVLGIAVYANAQISTQNARREYSGTAIPTFNCNPGPIWRDIYIRTTDGSHWDCTAAPNTWTKVVSGGTPGTVTSVTGTTNQINVATGTTTPALTLSSTIIAPGTVTATTSVASPFFASTAADPADAGAIRLGNNEFIEWEANPTGTDASLGVNASNVLVSSVQVSAPTLVSTVATGTAPLTVTSTTQVANLNAATAGTATDTASKTGTGSTYATGTAPTITNPVIANIAPGTDFTLTQNAVVPFTSVNASAAVNTLYLKAGNVGMGTATPGAVTPTGITFDASARILEVSNPTGNKQVGLFVRANANAVGLDITGEAVATGSVYMDSRYDDATLGGFLFRTRTAGTPIDALKISGGGTFTMATQPAGSAASDSTLCVSTTGVITKSAAACVAASSRLYKHGFKSLNHGLDWLMRMPTQNMTWTWNADMGAKANQDSIGPLAEEMAAIDRRLAFKDGNVLGLNDRAIMAVIIKSVQEQQRQIEVLKKQVSAQQRTINRLRHRR